MSIIGRLRDAAQTIREAGGFNNFTPWARDLQRARAYEAETARLRAGMLPERFYRQQTAEFPRLTQATIDMIRDGQIDPASLDPFWREAAFPTPYVSHDGQPYRQADPHEIDLQYWPAPDHEPDEWSEPGDAPGDWWAGPTDEYPTLQAWVEAHPDQAAASGVYPSQQAWLDAHQPSSAELDALEADQERRDQAAMEDPESYGDFWAYQPTPADYRETLPQEGPFGTLQDWREQRDEYESLSGDARARYLSDRAAEIAEGGSDMADTVTVRMLRDGVTAEDVQQVFGTADAWATTAQAQPPPTVAEEAMRSAIAHGVGPYAQAHADDPEAGSALDGYEAAQTVEEAAAFAGIGPAELEADLEAENGPAHADYPHEPSTLYDCTGCESGPCAHPEGEGDDWCVSGQHRQRQADPIQENEPAPEVIQGAVEPSAEWHREPDGYADEMTEIRDREAGANDGFMAAPVAQKEAGS